ncbi:unnamed protein product, partial [Rotaria magnacalcarata]
ISFAYCVNECIRHVDIDLSWVFNLNAFVLDVELLSLKLLDIIFDEYRLVLGSFSIVLNRCRFGINDERHSSDGT